MHILAAHVAGFFYVTGHSIPAAPLFAALRSLFGLPEPAKAALDARLSPLHRGFTGLGGSHNCVPEDSCAVGPDRKESYLLGAEGSRSPMHGPNVWPTQLPGWQQQVQAYFAGMLQLSRVVARGLALSLGLPEAFFTDKMHDPVAQLLLLRYPPPPQNSSSAPTAAAEQQQQAATGAAAGGTQQQQQPQHVGCGTHTDCGFLTILAQDDVPGLQVKMASDKWVIAPTIPGAFLVNLGDMTAMWTNGLYKSTEHRVFNSSSRARYSAPFFCNCDFDAVVEPAATAAAAAAAAAGSVANGTADEAGDGAAKYTSIKAGHYIMQKLGLMWDEQPTAEAAA
ncbi:hypothetical protein COO60DRAFT_1642805 [Scenedesmus sp. NREL 46B-D3]|nr:hypothetical protein COO60DRAFT_1642805 [Scenedesmus sp. NREL 46B-D3]